MPGRVTLTDLNVPIPEDRRAQALVAAKALGDQVRGQFPFVEGASSMAGIGSELILNRTWRPTLTVTGAGGLPNPTQAGNVLRPGTTLRLSFRIPPTCDPETATKAITEALTEDPPYGAQVSFEGHGASGWNAPVTAPWLEETMEKASQAWFQREAVLMGEGGTIPFMGMLGEKFPEAQFLITGVLGPASNAHGPNEFLHVPYGKKLTGVVAQVVAEHYRIHS